MDERSIGTNAMGTCIEERAPLQVSGSEHFVSVYHRWTCSAAPIWDPDGTLIGTLDLTGYSDGVHSHTLGMVVAAAHSISKMMEAERSKSELSERQVFHEAILDTFQVGVVVMDLNGNIDMTNNMACDMFGYDKDDMRRINARKLLRDWDSIRRSLLEDGTEYEADTDVFSRKNRLQYNVSIYRLTRGNNDSIVMILREVRKQRKLAEKLMGRRAIYTFEKIIGQDPNFIKVLDLAKKISDSKSTVLLMGESGTGKELFAQSIHNRSTRSREPFIALNCGAIPRNLIESELFGYEEGAFTGAKSKGMPGKFEIADGGTLFLDEIGEMPIDLQTRLLRVIEEGTVSRIGSIHDNVVNVRVIAATNRELRDEVERGTFRKDLYYRLNVLPLRLPSLKERRSDIPVLFDFFMGRISKKHNKKRIDFTRDQMDRLMEYDWPGNIRELENYVELVVNTESAPDIFEVNRGRGDMPIAGSSGPSRRVASLGEIEKEHILFMLEHEDWNISKASKALEIGRNTLYRKLEGYGLDVSIRDKVPEWNTK
jgi:PAS domain S-box-containing protein